MDNRDSSTFVSGILNHWDEMAPTLFPEGIGPGLKALLDSLAHHAGGPPPVEHPVAFGNQTRFLYRLSPEFTVDRPQGPVGGGYADGPLHQSVHYKSLHGGSFWAHLAGLVLAHVGLETLKLAGDKPSQATADLFEKSLKLNRMVEILMFSTVNLLAQCGMLEEALDRVEVELQSLEMEGKAEPQATARRARLLEVILAEKGGQVGANVQNNLRMLSSC